MGNGNLTISDRDLSIAGTGLDATIDRFYNSEPPYSGSVGKRWRMWPQSEERLYFATEGLGYVEGNNSDVMWQGGPDEQVIFSKRPDGTYISPHGYRATLTLVTEGGLQVFKLVLHESGVTYNFFSQGYVRDISDRNGNKITFAYTCDVAADECYMASMTDTQGRVTTFERAGQHQVTKATDPAGRVHTYAYTTISGEPVLASYTDPSGAITSYEYVSPGLLTKVTDPNANVTRFTYAGQRLATLTRVTDPAAGTGPTWSFNHSVDGQTKLTDARGNTTTHHYDKRGRVTRVLDALGHERKSTYDSNSNVIDRTSAMANKTIATFDANSNLKSSTLPTGAKTTMDYTNTAFKYFPTKVTNPQGGSISFGYDAKGNVATATDSMPTAGVSAFTYNPNGTPATSTDPRGKVTTFGYDANGNLTSVTPPAPLGATTIAYDGLSRPTSVTDGKGQVTTTSYDALDRVTQTSFAGGQVRTK
jgi:YD repeat-containing protein